MQKTTPLLAVALAFSASSGQDKINGTGVSPEANKNADSYSEKIRKAIALLPQEAGYLAVPGNSPSRWWP